MRGGGRGGFSDRARKSSGTSGDRFKTDEACARRKNGASETGSWKHCKTQPAAEPQSSMSLLHGAPSRQQSAWGAVKTVSGDMARAMPPASGSAATERATRPIRRARTLSMPPKV